MNKACGAQDMKETHKDAAVWIRGSLLQFFGE